MDNLIVIEPATFLLIDSADNVLDSGIANCYQYYYEQYKGEILPFRLKYGEKIYSEYETWDTFINTMGGDCSFHDVWR